MAFETQTETPTPNALSKSVIWTCLSVRLIYTLYGECPSRETDQEGMRHVPLTLQEIGSGVGAGKWEGVR